MEQSRLPNLFKRLRASAVKPAVAEDDDDNIEASDQQALAARLRSELQANMEASAQQGEEARMRSRKLRKDLEQIYDKLMEQKADLPDCFLSEIVASIKALQKWQRPKNPSNELRAANRNRCANRWRKTYSRAIRDWGAARLSRAEGTRRWARSDALRSLRAAT